MGARKEGRVRPFAGCLFKERKKAGRDRWGHGGKADARRERGTCTNRFLSPLFRPSVIPFLPTHLLIQHHLLPLHVPARLLLAEQAPTRADDALPNVDPHKLQVQVPAWHHTETTDGIRTINVGQQNAVSHHHHRARNHNLVRQNISITLRRSQNDDGAGLGRNGVAELISIGDTARIVNTGAGGLG